MRFFAFLVFLLFCVYALFVRYYYVCDLLGECSQEIQEGDTRFKNLELKKGDELVLANFDQFAYDSASISPDLNDNNLLFIDTLVQTLEDRENDHLLIRASFRDTELAISDDIYENIGIARAASLRNDLVEEGIDAQRISLDYEHTPYDNIVEPVHFELYAVDKPIGGLVPQVFSLKNISYLDSNFSLDPNAMEPGPAFMEYVNEIKSFFADNPDHSLTIIGHTDNQGSDSYNFDLGLRMARSVATYLTEQGIEVEIKAESQGEKQPVASNDTEKGQKKNRRLNFLIQKL